MVGRRGSAGGNATGKGTHCPAANTIGRVTPVIWNSEVRPWIALIVTGDVVWFTIVSVNVLVVPRGTVPKFRLPVAKAIGLELLEPANKPWQPVSSNRPLAVTRDMPKRRRNR